MHLLSQIIFKISSHFTLARDKAAGMSAKKEQNFLSACAKPTGNKKHVIVRENKAQIDVTFIVLTVSFSTVTELQDCREQSWSIK